MPVPDEAPDEAPAGRLKQLVIEVLERLDQVPSDGRAAGPGQAEALLDEVCRAHPEHAERLRARVGALLAIGLIDEEAQAGPAQPPTRVGDFDLLERVGSGGMGVVYRAVQRSLGREVAIKLIRPDALHVPGARERFARETNIVARLQHPGIVPIHVVGGEDDVPYYAMELVSGCTLAEALAQLQGRVPSELQGRDLLSAVCAHCGAPPPEQAGAFFDGSWEEVCLRVVRQVADALEHAHGRGVLHRDLKPSNVMLTPEGRVLLVDFGLSRIDGGEGVTRTTDQVGSLPYMSPELLRDGVRVLEARSDVYALGVTLYELLTLRLPFAAGSAPATMMRIVEGRPVRPRSHNPLLSWEAETVCLAAMDRDPRRRYASATALARDLTHAMQRMPLDARRAGALLRLRRWIAHRPGVAAAVLLALLLPTLAALLLGREARRVRAALAQVSVQEQRALANRDHALVAIDAMLRELDAEALYDVAGMDDVRLSILERADSLCATLLGDLPDDPRPALLAARCDESRAGIAAHAGRLPDAERLRRRAVERLEPWLEDPSVGSEVLHLVARCQSALATVLRAQGRHEEATRLELESIARLRELLRLTPDSAEFQAELLLLLSGAVLDSRARGDRERGGDEFTGLLEAGRELASRNGDPMVRTVLASLLHGYGSWLDREGRPAEALAIAREELEMRERLARDDPRDRIHRHYLVRSLSSVAGRLMVLGEDREALPIMQRCVDLAQALYDEFPDDTDTIVAIADAQLNHGAVLARLERRGEARDALDAAISALAEMLERQPTNAELHRTLGTALLNLASTEADEGELAAAQATCEAAREALVHAAALAPHSDDVGSWLALERNSRARILLDLEDPAAAAEALVDTPSLARHRTDRLRACLLRLEECLERARRQGAPNVIARCEEALRRTLVGVDRRADMQGTEVVERLRGAVGVK